MARRRSGSRGRRNNSPATPSAPRNSQFGDPWLQDFRERGGQFADLTQASDRRRWHPSQAWPARPLGLSRQPRIVIVDEHSALARHQTYGGRYSLSDVQRPRKWSSPRYGVTKTWTKQRQRGLYGVHDVIRSDLLPYRIGFTLPWQVIICVRRKRRRQVLHALGKTGRGATRRMKPRKNNHWSEVRC